MHHRDASGSTRKTITLISGRGSRGWTSSVGSRRSGILVVGASRTPTVSYRALTNGRLTTFRQSVTEVLNAGAGGCDTNTTGSSQHNGHGGSNPECRTLQ